MPVVMTYFYPKIIAIATPVIINVTAIAIIHHNGDFPL